MNRDYIYHSFTRSLCSKCGHIIDARIVYNDRGVFIIKSCPSCGEHIEILEEDFGYHLCKNRFDKPGTKTKLQTTYQKGCPFDCGLCESHDQHTCIGLIEITNRCDINCPVCYAKNCHSGDLPLNIIEKMIDFYIEAENGDAEILQISGGEPALHKDVLNIIELAKSKGVKYVMLNTNGLRIAQDEDFVRSLAQFRGGFEVYLQYDGTDPYVYERLRGIDLYDIKKKAVENLNKYSIPTTLVSTIMGGVNDHLCGEILVYGMKQPSVRGVNFQPLGFYGETVPGLDRVTLSGVLSRIEKQTGQMIRLSDFIPLPCNVERVAITYLFRDKKGFIPITRDLDMSEFKGLIGNTFMFTVEDTLRNFNDDSRIFNVCACLDFINDIKKYLPQNFIFKSGEEKRKFVDENTFRISVSYFVDRFNFDMKSMQKECVHIITPDLKRVPFSAHNMLHRRAYDRFYM